MKIYDAAFVPCREPDPTTGEFPLHHDKTLLRALELLELGTVESIVLSGRYATWYDNHGIVPWFGTEADASENRIIELARRPELDEPIFEIDELMERILKDREAQDSIANFLHSGEDIFAPLGMKNVLVLAAEERIPRLRSLGRKILDGVVALDFESTGPSNDPWLAQKEPFTLAIQDKYLESVPNGKEGWPVLKSWFYTTGIYRFWISFDAAQQNMARTNKGAALHIPDIVANMDPTGLPHDIMMFAAAAAGKVALANQ